MFWLESKPLELYEALIGNYNLVDIQDLSPGSGCLAKACLKSSVQYTGFVSCAKHKTWLENVLNLEAARQICNKDSGMFQQTLADALQTWFADELTDADGKDVKMDDDSKSK